MGLLKTFVLCASVAYVAAAADAYDCNYYGYVQAGDTCTAFANRHRTTVNNLFYCNGKIANPSCNNLVVGDILYFN